MRRFVVRAFLFSAVVVVTFGGICALEIAAELRAYRAEVVAPEGATVAIAGDSQAAMGVDSLRFPVFFNFSAHGKTLDQAWFTLEDIVAANPGRIRTVILDITPANVVGLSASRLRDMDYAAQFYLLHFLHPDGNFRDLGDALGVMRDNMVGRRLRLFSRALRGKRKFTSSLFGQFTEDHEVLSRMSPRVFQSLVEERAAEVAKGLPLPPDSRLSTVLDGVAGLRGKGVEVVLMTTPWSAELRRTCDAKRLEAFFGQVRGAAAQRGLCYLNFFDFPVGPEGWRDGHHLNATGARPFTAHLMETLKAKGLLK